MTARIVTVAALLFLSAVAEAQKAPRGEVLILGTFHMANPGRDLFNTQADDVLASKRQGEIAQVIEVLKRFRPTKIAIESMGDRRPNEYAAYVAGKHELSRNEIEQLGFRLAKELGHKTIYPVDADGEFPYLRLVKYAKATGRAKELDALMEEIGATVKANNQFLSTHTILETLVAMNSGPRVTQELGYYFRQAELGEPYDWAGADLVADWFRRNMRIYSNIAQLSESSEERILVIYGSGHLGWLQFAFGNNPDFRLRKLGELLK